MEIKVALDAAAAASLAAGEIERRLRAAIARRGSASLAVSGGATPGPMLAELATGAVDWHAVTVFQVDERVAPDGDPDRNANILEPFTATAARLELMPVNDSDLQRAAGRYATLLPARLDVVHLGVGDDGHTASWPPGDPVIDAPGAVAVSGVYRGRVRVTLTPAVVNAARFRLLLAAGAAKAVPLERWLAGDCTLPVARVHRRNTMLVVDAKAAPATRSGR